MKKQKTHRYYYLSAGLHLLVLVMGLSFTFSKATPLLGDPAEQTIQSYVFQGDPQPAQLEQHKQQATSQPVKQQLTGLLKNNMAPKKMMTMQKEQAAAVAQNTSHGEQSNELLTLLHSAIQQQQKYPSSAMQLEREGRVTVSFSLSPAGIIQGLRLLKSSGTDSLDTAALDAVKSAAPFNGVHSLLSEPKTFNIDVVFKLG
jgi:TonB family protein